MIMLRLLFFSILILPLTAQASCLSTCLMKGTEPSICSNECDISADGSRGFYSSDAIQRNDPVTDGVNRALGQGSLGAGRIGGTDHAGTDDDIANSVQQCIDQVCKTGQTAQTIEACIRNCAAGGALQLQAPINQPEPVPAAQDSSSAGGVAPEEFFDDTPFEVLPSSSGASAKPEKKDYGNNVDGSFDNVDLDCFQECREQKLVLDTCRDLCVSE